MLIYRCEHCNQPLGPVVDGEPEPTCPDHPNGLVSVVEYDAAD